MCVRIAPAPPAACDRPSQFPVCMLVCAHVSALRQLLNCLRWAFPEPCVSAAVVGWGASCTCAILFLAPGSRQILHVSMVHMASAHWRGATVGGCHRCGVLRSWVATVGGLQSARVQTQFKVLPMTEPNSTLTCIVRIHAFKPTTSASSSLRLCLQGQGGWEN